MKKSHKGIRKVSNPEFPIEALYVLGGITVFGVGFFIWRAARNVKEIGATFQEAVAIANEEGGDYAERAAATIRSAPQTERFVNNFQMGGGSNQTPTPSVITPSTTTPVSTTESTPVSTPVSTPSTTETVSGSTPSASQPATPIIPSREITDSQRDAILALAPGNPNLRNPRNTYERGLSNSEVANFQRLLIRTFNSEFDSMNINEEAFADGNIGRMTRALIFWVRNHPSYALMTDQTAAGSPETRVYLYGDFLPRLEQFSRLDRGRQIIDREPSGPAGPSSVDRGSDFLERSREWRGITDTVSSTGIISVKSRKRKL